MSDDPASLLAMLQRDPAAARELLEANLAQLAAADPRAALIMQLMSARPAPVAQAEARQGRAARVRSHIAALREALLGAHELLDDLAGALGACRECWGDLHDCPACEGRGGPGWRLPDEHLFAELVAPAVRRRARNQPKEGNQT